MSHSEALLLANWNVLKKVSLFLEDKTKNTEASLKISQRAYLQSSSFPGLQNGKCFLCSVIKIHIVFSDDVAKMIHFGSILYLLSIHMLPWWPFSSGISFISLSVTLINPPMFLINSHIDHLMVFCFSSNIKASTFRSVIRSKLWLHGLPAKSSTWKHVLASWHRHKYLKYVSLSSSKSWKPA